MKEMSISALTKIAKELEIAGATGMRKQELIFEILRVRAEKSGNIFSEGMPCQSRNVANIDVWSRGAPVFERKTVAFSIHGSLKGAVFPLTD